MKNIILETKNITKSFFINSKKNFIALKNINIKIQNNEIICISGSSGVGKSTLLNILSGLLTPTSGEVLFLNVPLPVNNNKKITKIRNKNFGFIFQSYNLLPEFNVLENIMMPLFANNINFKIAKEKALNLLEKLDILDKQNNFPISLSGGEKQRVAIARAIINNPEIIFADEPTGNLDQKNSENIYEILEKYWGKNKTTIIMVSHDRNIKFSNYRKIILQNGEIINL